VEVDEPRTSKNNTEACHNDKEYCVLRLRPRKLPTQASKTGGAHRSRSALPLKSDMGDAYYIVEKLREAPYNSSLDLLSFRCAQRAREAAAERRVRACRSQSCSTYCAVRPMLTTSNPFPCRLSPSCSEKTPLQLIELLGDVCGSISPKHAVSTGCKSSSGAVFFGCSMHVV